MLTPNIMPKLSVGRIGRETSDKITRSFVVAANEDDDFSTEYLDTGDNDLF